MPYLSDIEDALVETIAELLKANTFSENNLYQPETILTTDAQIQTLSGLVNVPVRIFRGFPVPNSLQLDLRNGIAEISIFPVPGMTRLMSKYFQDSYTSSIIPITLTATVSNNSVTFGGTGSAGQITGIAVGDGQIKTAYCMRLTNNDTPTTVATTLQGLIPNATRNGTTVTVPGVTSLLTGVAGDATINTDNSLISQMIDIRLWTPNPESRDVLGAFISRGMSQIFNLDLPDGSSTQNIMYRGIWVDDMVESTTEWSSYFRYEVIYPITTQEIAPGFLFLGIKLNSDKLVGAFDYRDNSPIV